MASAMGGVGVGGAGNVWSVYRAFPYPVSSVQTVTSHRPPGLPSCPLPGLTSATQFEAISTAVMAQMSEMFAAFQAQISDLLAKVNVSSSASMPTTSSTVTLVTVVKSKVRLASSSIEALASTVRHQPTSDASGDEVAPVRKYSSSSGPESAM